MKKKTLTLTESDLKKIVLKLLDEQFDYDYYDIILDLYNEVGLEGMTDDEIKYLKSGGESNIPDRFLGGDVDIEDEEEDFLQAKFAKEDQKQNKKLVASKKT